MKDSLLSLFQEPPKRPIYRERGKFRRETEDELRARVGEYHYGTILMKRRVIAAIVASDPWSALLKRTSFQ